MLTRQKQRYLVELVALYREMCVNQDLIELLCCSDVKKCVAHCLFLPRRMKQEQWQPGQREGGERHVGCHFGWSAGRRSLSRGRGLAVDSVESRSAVGSALSALSRF